MKSHIVLCASFITLTSTAVTGGELPPLEQLPDQVVRLSVTQSTGRPAEGFGLILGTEGRRQFVITAKHVLGTTPTSIRIRYKESDNRWVPQKCVSHPRLDIAYCELPYDADHAYQGWTTPKQLKRGDKLLFVGRDDEWYIPSVPAVINSVRSDGFLLDSIDVREGTSGAPLYNEDGVFGIISKKYSSYSAVAVSILDVLLLMRSNGVVLPEGTNRLVVFSDASKHGETFVRAELDRQKREYPESPGSTDYIGPIIANVFPRGASDLLQVWHSSGFGGGNHYEFYLSLFKSDRWRAGIVKPDFTLQIGTDLTNWPDFDFSKFTVESDENDFDGLIVKIPGCKKAATDSHAECSLRTQHFYTFCKENKQQKLIDLGEKYNADEEATEFAGINAKISNPVSVGDESWRSAGIPAKAQFRMLEITSVDKDNDELKVQPGDKIVSVNGSIFESIRDFRCRWGDNKPDELAWYERKLYVWRPKPSRLFSQIIHAY
ncbi:trypsin-like peptidase domain-containing protein [Bradyrhizobium sp. CAR08]